LYDVIESVQVVVVPDAQVEVVFHIWGEYGSEESKLAVI
jgi:hypothetical protein